MIYLIIGPPCAGKTTYVNNRIKRGDLVLDVDLLYGAISGQDPHNSVINIHEIAIKLSNVLADIIKNREGEWGDVYILSIANTSEKIKKEIERVNADKVIFIDTPYEVCIERAANRPPYFVWLIQEWFETKEVGLCEEQLQPVNS